MNRFRIANVVVAGVLVFFVGCSNPMKRNEYASVDPVETSQETAGDDISLVSASEAKSKTFFDSKELQYDTGKTDEGADRDFKMTPSGLRYRILRKSNGQKPTALNKVTVHYRGWLDNGRVFDSSYDRGEPISFPLNGVVAGWTEGMQLVGQGGMIELWLPSRLGYGAQGSPPSVPPYATLHFVVELLDIN